MKQYENDIRTTLAYMPYAEIMYVSAKTGQRLNKLYDMIDMVIDSQTLRIQTGVLNEIMMEAVAMQQPPSDKGKRLKLYYITQVSVKPPTFVIFVNDKELMHFSYTRYLENKIREAFGFRGTSLKFFIRERKERISRYGTNYLSYHRICVRPVSDRIFLGKLNHVDIRKTGSGNSGSTNALRVLGVKAGLMTFAGDVLKCVLPILLVRQIFSGSDCLPLLAMYTGSRCHTWT